MRGKLYEAISRRNFLKGSSVAAAAAAVPAGLVRSLPAEAADPSNPFPHGVASGDPMKDRVMLWTRLNPDFVEANAAPGQEGVRSKPRCKGCKVESGPTSRTGRPGCKGCKVERDPAARAAVQAAGLIWEVVTFGEKLDPRNPLEMSDDDFDDGLLVASGSATAAVANDYTVKIDASGLVEGTYYYYRFSHGGVTSPIARTKTLPANPTSAKIALISCSSIPHGYFNAYGALAGAEEANRGPKEEGKDPANFDDVDVVLCLGDYIYEYAQRCYPEGDPARPEGSTPQTEMITLPEYRARHRQYKLDADLQTLHRKFPMINVWDDHETADNSYPNGAVNHTPGETGSGPNPPSETDPSSEGWAAEHCNESGGGRVEGDWKLRLSAGKQSYYEYLPVRVNEFGELYRTFSFGRLADLIMLDTRLLREGPGCDEKEGAEACGLDDTENINSDKRFLLGEDQLSWLSSELDKSTGTTPGSTPATWQILGQQIMVGQLRVIPTDQPSSLLGRSDLPFAPGDFPLIGDTITSEGVIYLTDIWDGWQASRERLYEQIRKVNAAGGDVVILTGDIHTAWANDIHPNPAGLLLPTGDGPDEPYNPLGPAAGESTNSLAVEFVCPSITSKGLPELASVQGCIQTVNPHVQYIDLQKHGFMILDVDENEVTGTWYNLAGNDDGSDIGTPGNYLLEEGIPYKSEKGSHEMSPHSTACGFITT